MKTTKCNVSRIVTRATSLLIIVLFAAAIRQTGGFRALAQERRPYRGIGNMPISEVAKAKDENRTNKYFCQQKISDLSILQRGAGSYEFVFRTTCATPVTIEFSDQPPVSLSPPRFKKAPYDPNKPLVPVITTGLIGDRTEHDLYANLGTDKQVDYYIITVKDGLGNHVYKAGSLVLDSVRTVRPRAKKYPG
jgi:hypothetical protein